MKKKEDEEKGRGRNWGCMNETKMKNELKKVK